MKSILNHLTDRFHEAALKAYPELQSQETGTQTEITPSTQDKFGHYQYNSAMKLAKTLKLNPRRVAENVVAHLEPDEYIAHTEIAGPGFVNITLKPEAISSGVDRLLRDPHLAIDLPSHHQRVMIDFSSPNTAKEMHVGHLRSTIIGDCLARLFEFLGHDVLALTTLAIGELLSVC